jgi:hypothetical protein
LRTARQTTPASRRVSKKRDAYVLAENHATAEPDSDPQLTRNAASAATEGTAAHVSAQTGKPLSAAQKPAPVEQTTSEEDDSKPAHDQTARAVHIQLPLPAADYGARAAEPPKLPAATPANAELVFLRRIQAALQASELDEVFALSREHEQRWPHGTFVQEREGLHAIAACQAHLPDAGMRARKFAAAYPRSPLLSRVRAACAPLLGAPTAK